MGSVVLDMLESVDAGIGEAREERAAVVDAKQNKRDRFGSSFCAELFSDLTDATTIQVTGLGSCRDKVDQK